MHKTKNKETNNEKKTINYALTALVAFALATISCSSLPFPSLAPLTKEDATKKIITDLVENCRAGKTTAVAAQWDKMMPPEEKQRRKIDKVDYNNPEHKRQIDRMCQEFNSKYSGGYEFGKVETQGEAVGWEIFPKGEKQGDLMAFKKDGENYVLIDIDPAKR